MLKYTNYDLQSLAELLDVSALLLSDVLGGKGYLKPHVGKSLMSWFLLSINE